MLRTAIILASACLLLSACQGESTQDTSANKTPAAVDGAATPGDSAPPASGEWTNTEPFGVASCDEFAAAIKQCFAATKMPASAAAGIRGGFEQEFERWRIMKADPDLQEMLKKTCDRHLKDVADTKMGLDCP